MKNNYLLLVTTKTIISKLKEESNITFLFPLKDFTVGFPHPFSLKEIKAEHAYLYLNRLLDNEGIAHFKKLLKTLPANIEGIVFDDIGILQVLKTTSNNLKTILFSNHLNCNFESINAYLDDVDSVVISPDITIRETKEILRASKKPLVVYTFGHVNIMYSRRLLITNYNAYFQKNVPLISDLTNDLKEHFKILENEYGTVIYTALPFNGLSYLNEANIKYHLINTLFLSDEQILAILHGQINPQTDYPYTYLSEEETIVRIKER